MKSRVLIILVFLVACGSRSRPPAKAPEAPRPDVVQETPPVAKEEVWPATLPVGWKVLNDYEGALDQNLWGGFVSTWSYHAGRCKLDSVMDGGSKRLKVTWDLPLEDSQCGTYEYLAGGKGKPKPVDISSYEKVVFLARSGDGQTHTIHFEVTELDPYDAALQGYVGDMSFDASPDWQRYEMDLDKRLHPMFDRKKGKQVGIRVDRKSGASGVVLLDNVTFVTRGHGGL